MKKVCPICGTRIFNNTEMFCCYTCKETAKTKLKNCEMCGKQFFVRNKHRKRCDICQAKYDRERLKKRNCNE